MKVLIIPEDPALDQYILKPVVEQLLIDLGLVARIEVLWNPRLRGVAQALNGDLIADIVATYPMVDLFLLLVDRDGEVQDRPGKLRAREEDHPGRLFGCLAIEEVEVWMLAVHRDALKASWTEIRAERDMKERFAHPFLAAHAPKLGPGEGRKWAMRELGARWRGVLEVCTELADLQRRLADWHRERR